MTLRGESGATLIEVLVANAVSGIVIAALVTFMVLGYRSMQSVSNVLEETEELALVRYLLADDVRSAYPDATLTFASGNGQKLTLGVYAPATGYRTIVYEYLSAGELTRTVYPYSAEANPPSPSPQTISRTLARSYGTRLFTVSGAGVTADLPLPGRVPEEPVRLIQIKSFMLSQTP